MADPAVDAQKHLLGGILSVMGISKLPERQMVDAFLVLTDKFFKCRVVSLLKTGYELIHAFHPSLSYIKKGVFPLITKGPSFFGYFTPPKRVPFDSDGVSRPFIFSRRRSFSRYSS